MLKNCPCSKEINHKAEALTYLSLDFSGLETKKHCYLQVCIFFNCCLDKKKQMQKTYSEKNAKKHMVRYQS